MLLCMPQANTNPFSSNLERILFQKLEKSLKSAYEPEEALRSLYQYGEAYKNHTSIVKSKVDDFLLDCQYKTLHEVFNKYFSKNLSSDDNQLPLIRNCSKVIPLLKNSMNSEQNKICTYVRNQFNWAAIQRHEMLRLVIYANGIKNNVLKRENPIVHVLDLHELKDYLTLLSTKPVDDKRARVQLLICNEVHYTAVDIYLTKKSKQCCILDAYHENKLLSIKEIFLQKGFDVVVVGKTSEGNTEQVQTDTRSCSLFSISQLTSTSHQIDFFQQLDQAGAFIKGKATYLSWTDFPPFLIKNSQDETLKETYLQTTSLQKWKGKEIISYLYEGRGIEKKLEKYIKVTNELLIEKTAAELTAIACQSPLRALEQLCLK